MYARAVACAERVAKAWSDAARAAALEARRAQAKGKERLDQARMMGDTARRASAGDMADKLRAQADQVKTYDDFYRMHQKLSGLGYKREFMGGGRYDYTPTRPEHFGGGYVSLHNPEHKDMHYI